MSLVFRPFLAALVSIPIIVGCGSDSPSSPEPTISLTRLTPPASAEDPPGLWSRAVDDCLSLGEDFERPSESWTYENSEVTEGSLLVRSGGRARLRWELSENSRWALALASDPLDRQSLELTLETDGKSQALEWQRSSPSSTRHLHRARFESTEGETHLVLTLRNDTEDDVRAYGLRVAKDSPAPGTVRRVKVGIDDERWVTAVDAFTAPTFDVNIPKDTPRLRTGVCYLSESTEPARLDVVFQDDDGEAQTLSQVSLAPAASPHSGEWRELHIPLDALAGQSGRLTLKLETEANMDAVALLGAPILVGTPEGERPPNVVMISVDTLRADRLSCYGHEIRTSPAIDALASRGVRIERAYSTSGYTLPSHASLLSGQYPSTHGATDGKTPMHPTVTPMLSEILSEKGYVTRAATSGGFVNPFFGFGRGFDRYTTQDPFGTASDPNAMPPGLEEVIDSLEAVRDQPFLLFMHTFFVHDYRAQMEDLDTLGLARGRDIEDYREAFVHLSQQQKTRYRNVDPNEIGLVSDLYDASIYVADRALGHFFDALEKISPHDETIVILISDHGEEFYEHGGLFHGHSIQEELVHIPMIWAGPGIPPNRMAEGPMSLADITPTLLGWLDIATDDRMQGLDLGDHLRGPGAANPLVLTELDYVGFHQAGLRDDRYRAFESLVGYGTKQTRESFLYDWRKDPAESRDVSAQDPRALRDMIAMLHTLRQGFQARRAELLGEEGFEAPALPPALVKRLQELGYVLGD